MVLTVVVCGKPALAHALTQRPTTATMPISSVDFSAFSTAEGVLVGAEPTAEQLATAAHLDEAMRTIGFVQLVNIGMQRTLKADAFEHARALFNLPDEYKKSEFARINPVSNQGYQPFRTEAVNKARAADLNESFNVLPPDHPMENDFSGCPAGFVNSILAFWQGVEGLARRYAIALAVAAQLPPDYFVKTMPTHEQWVMRMNHYPPCEPAAEAHNVTTAALRIGEHTDFGGFTLLFLAAGATGLQIKPVHGGEVGAEGADGWLSVQPPTCEDSVIVNTGSMLARWTNDVWRATAHRVIVPDEESARQHRYSIACFIDPDGDTSIEAHPKFVKEGGGARYAPIGAKEHKVRLLEELMRPLAEATPTAMETGHAVADESEC